MYINLFTPEVFTAPVAPQPVPIPMPEVSQQAVQQPITQVQQPQPQTIQPAPQLVAQPQPVAPQQPQQPVATRAAATTVPRGESLTREQINERVKQLEALAQQQRGQNQR